MFRLKYLIDEAASVASMRTTSESAWMSVKIDASVVSKTEWRRRFVKSNGFLNR